MTASVKHYMGVVSQGLSGGMNEHGGRSAHNVFGTGGMGTPLAETRFPMLNILDVIWIDADLRGGPGSNAAAINAKVIAASTDPVALDRWAAKNILMSEPRPRVT